MRKMKMTKINLNDPQFLQSIQGAGVDPTLQKIDLKPLPDDSVQGAGSKPAAAPSPKQPPKQNRGAFQGTKTVLDI
jgi:hypothetical protein